MADLETVLRSQIDASEEWRTVEKLSTLERLAGTDGEKQAVDYILSKLGEYGIPSQLYKFDSFISYPLEAEMEVLEPVKMTIACRPRAFAASTPAEGIEAEMVFLPSESDHQDKGKMIFSQAGRAEDYEAGGVAGKIVLTTGGGPDGVKNAQASGAVAHVHIWPSDEEVIHEMIVSSIWGTPTPESVQRLVKIPAISVKRKDGEKLIELCRQGKVKIRLKARVWIGWKQVLLPVAFIDGKGEPDKFLLVGGHHCSWYFGTTDNATGDACLLEIARVLHKNREGLRRSVRVAWWPSHSQGRYAGSTWYADNFFDELRRNCIGYLGIDSPGVRNAKIWDCRYNHGEVEKFMDKLMREVTGDRPNIRRPFKAGDQSFWGVGLPSFGAYRMVPPEHPDRGTVGGSGGGFWWHSPEDTIDKGDPKILAADTQLLITIVSRLCTAEKLPYEFVTAAKDFERLLAELNQAAEGHLDLAPVVATAEGFEAAAAKLEALRDKLSGESVDSFNAGLMRVSRIINPVLYTATGDFEQDPALQLPLLPAMQPARKLAKMDPASDDYRFLRTKLVRERNRIEDALYRATLEVNRLVKELA